MVNFTLTWHPRFNIQEIGSKQVVFLGEQEQFLMPKEAYDKINVIVEKKGRLSDYIFDSANMMENIQHLEQIDKLIADQILQKGEVSTSTYVLPDFSCPYQQLQVDERRLYLLSELIDLQLIQPWLDQLSFSEDYALVIVDDYLDPRIEELYQEFQSKEQAWILCKPTGEAPMVGPVFNPKKTNSACYHCLFKRLIQNIPVRAWLKRELQGEAFLPTPILKEMQQVTKNLKIFDETYLSAKAMEQHQQKLYTLSEEEGWYHVVQKRPQCQSCGDPSIIEQNWHTPLVLQEQDQHSDDDGGYRKLSRAETIANIQPCISPITGLLAEFHELSNAENDELSIFQAAYYQTTRLSEAITADTFVQLSLGKGVSKEQAITSVLGEALERQAAQFNGEEYSKLAKVTDLDAPAYLPQDLSPFSEKQYQAFSQFDGTSLHHPQWVKPFDENEAIYWIKGWSLTKEKSVYFPFAHCIANTPYEDQHYSLYTHNGNAAGNTKEEAILQGLLELIERDAGAIWWYNKVPRPSISLEIIPEQPRKVISNTLDQDWDYWLLDISNDIEVVTCVAVGQHKENEKFVMGFGTHLDPAIAAQRALTEMYQLILIKDKVTGPFDFDAIPPHPFLFSAKRLAEKTKKDFNISTSTDIKTHILTIQQCLEKVGLNLCVVNYSRPDVPLNTLKVIVPGLCHFWPQFATDRLCQVPVKLNWLSKPLKEEELNPMDLYL